MLRKIRFILQYLIKPRWDTGITPPELIEYIDTHSPGKALDLGCGTGTNVITLAQHGWKVIGVDFVPSAIKTARRKAQKLNIPVEFIRADVSRLNQIKTTFDLILDIGCYHAITEKQQARYLDNISRQLSKNGTYLLYAFINPHPESGNPGLSPKDIEVLESVLNLTSRKDGIDQARISTWMTFERY